MPRRLTEVPVLVKEANWMWCVKHFEDGEILFMSKDWKACHSWMAKHADQTPELHWISHIRPPEDE